MHIFSDDQVNRQISYARDTLVKKYGASKILGESKNPPGRDLLQETLAGLEKMLASYDLVREHVQSMITGPYECEFSQMYSAFVASEMILSTVTVKRNEVIRSNSNEISAKIDFSKFHPQPINQIICSYLAFASECGDLSAVTDSFFALINSDARKDAHDQKYAKLNDLMEQNPFTIFSKQFAGFARSKSSVRDLLSWDSIGGYEQVKTQLMSVSQRLSNIQKYSRYLHLEDIIPDNILLIGPPGTGKTLLARTFCETSNIGYHMLAGTDIRSTYVNGSANNLAAEFDHARRKITDADKQIYAIFIDEFDELAAHRNSGNSREDDKLVNELNQVLDGIKTQTGIFVIGATNHYESIDPAIRSRFGLKIYVDLPDEQSRISIFQKQLQQRTQGTDLEAHDVDYQRIAEITSGYSCRTIRTIVKHTLMKKADSVILSGEIPAVTTHDILTEVQSGKYKI